MILRQFAVRHGRSVVAASAQYTKRTYASEITHLHPASRLSAGNDQPETETTGHRSDMPSVLDQANLPPTRATREISEELASIIHDTSSVQGDLNAHMAAKAQMAPQLSTETTLEQTTTESVKNSERLIAFYNSRRQQRTLSNVGSKLVDVHEPWEMVKNPPRPEDVTLPMLLANQTHLGHATELWNPSNSSYIFGIRDGIHIISLEITLAYLRRAAKVVQAVAEKGGIILFVGTRKGQQEIVVNSARLAEGYHVFDRWIGGLLTNGQQILSECRLKVVNSMDREIEEYRDVLQHSNHPVLKPDLVICLNPLENETCLRECGIHNVPTIGVIDTDANPSWVTYPIPSNDDSLRSIALIAGVLGRAAQRGQVLRREAAARGEITYDTGRARSMLQQLTELRSIDAQPKGDRNVEKDE